MAKHYNMSKTETRQWDNDTISNYMPRFPFKARTSRGVIQRIAKYLNCTSIVGADGETRLSFSV